MMKFIDYPKAYLCEYCGHESRSRERCSHCGHVLADPPECEPPRWGRMVIRLKHPEEAEEAWRRLAGHWRQWESRDGLRLIRSQMGQFETLADTLELYGSNLEVSAVRDLLKHKASVTFEELPGEQIPRRV